MAEHGFPSCYRQGVQIDLGLVKLSLPDGDELVFKRDVAPPDRYRFADPQTGIQQQRNCDTHQFRGIVPVGRQKRGFQLFGDLALVHFLISSFMITYDIEGKSIGEGAGQDLDLSTGIFADDMTEIFVTLGKAAVKSGDTIVVFIDEVQLLTKEEMNGMIVATHRCNQLRLPVMLFCAGLPKILKTVGEACFYSERLFRFEPVGALTESAARAAIVDPVKDFGVSYADDAVHHIIRITGGYPCFIQKYCSVLWNDPNMGEAIDLSLVKSAESVFFNALDHDFFAVWYNRCTNLEKAFMTAMVKSESLPCTIADVAKRMNRKITQISPVQGQLINKDMIYPTGYAGIDFAVPQFDHFIKRTNPDLLIPL